MENFKANIKNLSKNKIYLILIGLAVVFLATVLIYAYVEFLSDKISVIPTEEGKPYCGAIGSRSEGWYSNIDGLIKYDNCEGCVAVCGYVGTRSEGWYVSGNCDSGLRLIKYDNCGEGQEEGNLPPVIDELTAPTQLQVNEKGVWTIKARDPENGALSYSVNWGDEYAKIALSESAPAELDTRSQTTTFTHSYNKIGTYTIKFIITDNHQQTAEVSTTVEVVSEISETTCTDSDGGINKYVKGTTCRKLHYGSSTGVDMMSCKTDMCDGICYSQSTSTNLEEKKDNVMPIPSTPPSNSEAPLVKEYYCENGKIMSKHIHCENGCKDGACVKEKQTCDEKCKSLNYASGICRTWPIVPDAQIGCKENEKDIGYTSDCYILKDVLGNQLVGIGKTCCCKIECNEKLNKEDCELVGGEYKCDIASTHTHCYCDCPCRTDSDCSGYNRCRQGKTVPVGGNLCYEIIHKCENGECKRTEKKYENYSCAAYYNPGLPGSEKCLDTCGDGVCKFPETKEWCPEDCKGETKPITVISPNGGEQWEIGGTYDITWEYSGAEEHVIFDLYDCNSSSCKLISLSPVISADQGKYSWKITVYDPGDKYKIQVTSFEKGQYGTGIRKDSDQSDNYFSIVASDNLVELQGKIVVTAEGSRSESWGIEVNNGPTEYMGKTVGLCGDLSKLGLNLELFRNKRISVSIEPRINCFSSYQKTGRVLKWEECEDEDCIPEGSSINTSGMQKCCAGLKAISCAHPNSQGECHNEDFMCDSFPCANCGNGICGLGENKCNCPEDCKEGETLSADLNCDGNVNLTDSAILLSFWEKDPSGATSCKSPDINQDGNVDLADFSIMMGQWTK